MSEKNLTVSTERLGAEIRELTRQAKAMTLYYGVEIGRRLEAAKSMVPYGGWGAWLKENTEFSQATATRFMRVFNEYGAEQIGIFGAVPESSTLQNLSISNALRLLAVPEDEREEFAEAVDAENLSARELEKAIKERDTARQERESAMRQANSDSLRAEHAKKEAEEAYEKLRGMEDELTAAKDEACRMAEELEALRKRPVEVAVQRDEQAIREAEAKVRAKVRAQAEAELSKKTDEWRKQTTKTEQEIERVRKEAENLKQQLAAAKAMADTASSDAEKERLSGEVEDLRRKLAMSDKDVTAASLWFGQWQAAFNQMTQAISRIEDEEKAAKLRAAIRAQLAAWGKAMDGKA